MKKTRKTDLTSCLWLIPVFLLSLIANGRWNVPVAMWLSLVFLLRFTRTQKPIAGQVLGGFTLGLAEYFGWRGLIPLPQPFYTMMILFTAFFILLPFLADRLIAPRLKGVLSTLVFPAAFTLVGYLGRLSDSGSWGAIAYTQWGNLPLLQMVSLAGIWGIPFLIGWFASVVNWSWEHRFAWKKIRPGVILFTAVFGAVLLFGGIRLTLFSPPVPTVTTASVIASQSHFDLLNRFLPLLMRSDRDAPELEFFREKTTEIHQDMFALTRAAARMGARIIAWSEGAVMVLKNDEPALLARGSELAREEGIYFAMALLTWDPAVQPPLENKVVLLTAQGEIAWEYHKARPVPGSEVTLLGPGSSHIPVHQSPYGQIGAVICYDADFPDLFHQGDRQEIDLLIVPSNDWREITPLHAQMAAMRAIEQGFSLLRPTSHGLSAAFDYQGRTLATLNTFLSDSRVMWAELPTRGTTTVYARTGDAFAWGSLLLLVLTTGWGMRKTGKKNRRKKDSTRQ